MSVPLTQNPSRTNNSFSIRCIEESFYLVKVNKYIEPIRIDGIDG